MCMNFPILSNHNEEKYFDFIGTFNAEIVQVIQYILEDSYICPDGSYSFLTFTMHHLCEPEDLLGCGDNTFLVHQDGSLLYHC